LVSGNLLPPAGPEQLLSFLLVQVAVDRTKPGGRILGIDIIPATPPKGVSTIQGNFLSPAVRADVHEFLQDPDHGRPRNRDIFSTTEPITEEEIQKRQRGYIDQERQADLEVEKEEEDNGREPRSLAERDKRAGRVADVVLSDMSAPWEQTSGFWKRSLSDPYHRMMNTSGMSFRDHAGSMVSVPHHNHDG
jgi:21S rRNA (uridine2791-2'-O)-methyltransferase